MQRRERHEPWARRACSRVAVASTDSGWRRPERAQLVELANQRHSEVDRPVLERVLNGEVPQRVAVWVYGQKVVALSKM